MLKELDFTKHSLSDSWFGIKECLSRSFPKNLSYIGSMSCGSARAWAFPARNGVSLPSRKALMPSARA